MRQKRLIAATALIALLVVLSACGSNPAEPDKVVGVLLKCTKPAQPGFDDAGVIPARDYSGDMCKQLLDNSQAELARTVGHYNAHYVVTVRTAAGSSYTLEVPATTRVRMGQAWPPGS